MMSRVTSHYSLLLPLCRFGYNWFHYYRWVSEVGVISYVSIHLGIA